MPPYLFSDILLVPWGLGQRLEYVSGAGPVLSPIRSAADLLRLSPARISSVIGAAAQIVHRVRGALGSSRTCKIADPIGRLKASLALLMRLSTRTKASLTQRSTRSDSTRTTPPHHGDLSLIGMASPSQGTNNSAHRAGACAISAAAACCCSIRWPAISMNPTRRRSIRWRTASSLSWRRSAG